MAAAGGLSSASPRLPPPAPLWHAVAFVNDSLSHGALGDGLLSLNEAILLHNGQLLYTQLSLAEQAQISLIPGTGSTTDVTWIDIDGANTPTITIEQDLAPVLDTSFGLLIKGFGDPVVLDFTGPGLTRGLLVPANAMSLQNLVFSGGAYGVDVTQSDVSGQAGCTLQEVRFEGQAQFGLRVVATTANGAGRLILERCTFVDCPTAIVFDEGQPGRVSIVEAHEVVITGSAIGIDATLGSGGSTRYTLDRVSIDASVRGLRLARPAGAARATYVEGAFVRVRAPVCAVIECSTTAAGATWALLYGWDLQAPPGGTALELGAAGAALFGEVAELTFAGDARIGAGAGPQPLALRNLRGRGGAVTLASSATQALVLDTSRFDGCAVTTAGSGAIAATGCCFVGGSLAGTAAAPLQLNGCHAPSPGAHVTAAQALPAPQLGSMSIQPEQVALGGTVQFVADLPNGLVGVFALGFTDPTPDVTLPGLHLYFDAGSYVMVPGVYFAQQGFTWAVPASAAYAGFDLVVHLAALPLPGLQAPGLQLPPPRRFVLQ